MAGGATADGTQIQLYTCNGSAAQTWTVTGSTLRALGKCLDVAGGATANGTKVAALDLQRQRARRTGRRRPTARCATRSPASASTSSGNNSADGQQVHIWDCLGARQPEVDPALTDGSGASPR